MKPDGDALDYKQAEAIWEGFSLYIFLYLKL